MCPARQRGSSLIEFALASTVLIPLLLGTVNIGMNLSRNIQVTHVSRDAGVMYARHTDFSIAGNKEIVIRLAGGLDLRRDDGDGRVILTRILLVGERECAAGGMTPAACPNYNYPAIVQRQQIGNPNLRPSGLGEPAADLMDPAGNIASYLTDPSVRAESFAGILQLEAGEVSYVSEAYFQASRYDFPGFFEGAPAYARTIF